MDPFATLGIPRRFAVDLRAIERTHRELARATHPDLVGRGSQPSSRAEALGRSVELNEAFRIVKEPVRRAEALFSLAGIPVGDVNEPKASPLLLGEILEKREALEEAKEAGDLSKVQELSEEIEGRALATEELLSAAFDRAKGDRAALVHHVPLLGELRFYRRFLQEVSAIEDALTEGAA